MNVEQVEYSKVVEKDQDGIRVVFTYDIDSNFDIFVVMGEPETSAVLQMIQSAPNPLHLLIALRKMTGITLH